MLPNTVHIEELKEMLKGIVWDYNISEDELLQVFLDDKKGLSITRPEIETRLLGYYGWHRIIKVVGRDCAFDMLRDEVISRIFPKSYQKRLYGVRSILSEKTLSVTG